jgi:hypothetical protein
LLINGHHRAEIAWQFAPRFVPTSEPMARTVHSFHILEDHVEYCKCHEAEFVWKVFVHACMFVYVECSSPYRRQLLNVLTCTEAIYCSLTMTYGISTSSSS